MATQRLHHIVLTDLPENNVFTSTTTGRNHFRILERDPRAHGAFLQSKLQEAWSQAENEQAVYHITRKGIYLEFKGEQGYDLVTKSLEDRRSRDSDKWIRLLNVRSENAMNTNPETGEQELVETTYATVFVPHNKKKFFLDRIERFAKEGTKSGKPKNYKLVNSIADLRKALDVESFWQDAKSLIPTTEPGWCEVWLSSAADEIIARFETLLEQQKIRTMSGFVRFPERTVKVIYADRSQLAQLTHLSDDIAEYRGAKETAAFWTELENRDQVGWVESLIDRIHTDDESQVSVCILDTGVNNGHPLLSPILADAHCQAVRPEWGTHDHDNKGHGTRMAGVAGYGDLIKCLLGNDPVELRHRLESVKILPVPPNGTDPELWGYITAQAVSRAEIQAPERRRIICMAVTSDDTRDQGRPSSWSAELDQLASGVDSTDGTQRLIIVSAGNLTDINTAKNYPDAQLADSVHDPAQSWNALTVGAYTAMDNITDPTLAQYEPVAPKDGLSPFTTTSCRWEDKWPNKPDIVMEGGNMARDSSGVVTECDDLSLLSTFHNPRQGHFFPFNMTSAATAQAAWFAAQIQASYPKFWPETIRALMVHSAKWTEALKQQFLENNSKASLKKLLRIAGYGVPDLGRALYSASNSLTLISQSQIQPYDRKEGGSGYRTKDMHLYDLPWPKEALLNLPDDTDVEMRITLSYFVEPGPGEVGWRDRYRYASHALRFDLNSPGESKDEFIRRINVAARNEEEGHPGTQSASDHWLIGSQARDKGSIHSDVWRGTPVELADSNIVAVTPRIGWWRERAHLNKWSHETRYSLVVSITTPDETIDIYTPVANQVGIAIPVSIDV